MIDKKLPRYVYIHTCINTGETLYVGIGTGERAWEWRSNKRSKEHTTLLKQWLSEGYVPSDWTTIVYSNLTNEKALAIEAELIESYKPKFNKHLNPEYISDKWKFNDVHKFAKLLKQKGYSYSNIAYLLGGSENKTHTMSAWRMVNAY